MHELWNISKWCLQATMLRHKQMPRNSETNGLKHAGSEGTSALHKNNTAKAAEPDVCSLTKIIHSSLQSSVPLRSLFTLDSDLYSLDSQWFA